MPLPIIDEETVLDSFPTTNNGSRPLGHSTFYGASSEDSTSIFSHSTNSTASNLPGPGRVLGNLYSLTGRRLERTLGDLAHKAGFSPEAIYQQISALYLENWQAGGRKAFILKNLCFQLLKQTKSITDSTRFRAIMRWGDILRDQHEIYVWLFSSHQERMAKHATALLRVIEEFESKTNTLSDLQDAVLCETSLLVNFHSVGLQFISLGGGELLLEKKGFRFIWNGRSDVSTEEIKEWGVVFQHVLNSHPNPTISRISQWYIDLWSSGIGAGNMHVSFALQSCLRLQSILKAVNPSCIDGWDKLAVLGKNLHEYFVGRSRSRCILLLAQLDDFVPCDDFVLRDGAPVHMPTVLNGLVRSYNCVFSSGLDIIPDITCIAMLGSTNIISADNKEKIRDFLKDLQNRDNGENIAFANMVFLQSCNKLLKRALSELDDTECFDKLSNATSFTDGTSRWALLQLGDILQSLPEVYMPLIILGGGEIRGSVESLRRSLKVSGSSANTLEHFPGILMDLRSLLACHAAGFRLAVEDTVYGWPLSYDVGKFIMLTTPSYNENYRVARELFAPYLMDNVTFDPLIFYLKYCIFQNWGSSHLRSYRHPLLSCSIVQGALLTERSVPQENRHAMEELCRTMQNSIIVKLRGSIESIGMTVINVGYAMRSVYMDLTGSKQTFEEEAEAYLLQLCNLFFEIITKTKDVWCRRVRILDFSNFLGLRNVFGWFLSIRGPDAEDSILRLLEDIDDLQMFYPKDVGYNNWPFSYLEAHKLGVELLAPRHEKLHFEGAGLAKHLSTRSFEPPLTPEQRERWTTAFKTLAANLSSADSDLMCISLFYFANCPLPYEADGMLDTALALEYCEKLQLLLSEDNRFESTDKHVKPDKRSSEAVWLDHNLRESWNIDESTIMENLSRAVSHIHTYLKNRVEFVQQSCTGMDVARSDIPKVVTVLDGLANLCKEKLGADAPELFSPADY